MVYLNTTVFVNMCSLILFRVLLRESMLFDNHK